MTTTALPTPRQRELLCDLIHKAFVEVRLLGWGGHAAQAADLADAFHNVPKEMYGWGSFDWDVFRGMLENYQTKWPLNPGPFAYAELLDDIRRQ